MVGTIPRIAYLRWEICQLKTLQLPFNGFFVCRGVSPQLRKRATNPVESSKMEKLSMFSKDSSNTLKLSTVVGSICFLSLLNGQYCLLSDSHGP